MYITWVFIDGVLPPKYNYYPMSLQWSYSQNIPGRTRNFPITIVSGLQLRWAPLPQAVFFASTLLVAHLRDVPYSEDGLRLIFGRPAEGPSVLRSPFALMLVLSHLRMSSASWPKSSEGWHSLRSSDSGARAILSSRTFGDRTEGGVPNTKESE